MYWALLTLGPVAIGISLAASSYLTGMAMAGHLSVYAKWLIPIGQLIFQSIILAALYKYVPNCRVLWRDALVGGSLIALVFTVFRWGFGIYVMRGSYTHDLRCLCRHPRSSDLDVHQLVFVLAGAAITATLPMLRARRYKDFDKSGDDLLSAVALLRILMLAKEVGNPQMTNVELADKIGSYPEARGRTSQQINSHELCRSNRSRRQQQLGTSRRCTQQDT